MKLRLQTATLNIKIKKVEIRKITAMAKLSKSETPSKYFFYYGWLRAWKKYMYKTLKDPWDKSTWN